MAQNTVTPKCSKCDGEKFETVKHSNFWLVACVNCGAVAGAVGESLELTNWALAAQSKAIKKIADHLGVKVDLKA